MTSATVRLLDFPAPDLRFVLLCGGNQRRIRKALRTACYKRRSAVKFDLPLFIPHLVRQLDKLGIVRMEIRSQSKSTRTDLTYSIGSGEDDAIMLKISGKESGKPVSFYGPFFRWLGNSELRITTNNTKKLVGIVRQNRTQKLAAIEAEYNKQHKGEHKFYTPLQIKMRRQRDQIIKDHLHRSESAKRRHERHRTARKLPADFTPEDDI